MAPPPPPPLPPIRYHQEILVSCHASCPPSPSPPRLRARPSTDCRPCSQTTYTRELTARNRSLSLSLFLSLCGIAFLAVIFYVSKVGRDSHCLLPWEQSDSPALQMLLQWNMRGGNTVTQTGLAECHSSSSLHLAKRKQTKMLLRKSQL